MSATQVQPLFKTTSSHLIQHGSLAGLLVAAESFSPSLHLHTPHPSRACLCTARHQNDQGACRSCALCGRPLSRDDFSLSVPPSKGVPDVSALSRSHRAVPLKCTCHKRTARTPRSRTPLHPSRVWGGRTETLRPEGARSFGAVAALLSHIVLGARPFTWGFSRPRTGEARATGQRSFLPARDESIFVLTQ